MPTKKALIGMLAAEGIVVPPGLKKEELLRMVNELSPVGDIIEGEEIEEIYEPDFGAFVEHADGSYGRVWDFRNGVYNYTRFGVDDVSDYLDGRLAEKASSKDLKPANEHRLALMDMRRTIVQTWHKDRAAKHRPAESGPPWALNALI